MKQLKYITIQDRELIAEFFADGSLRAIHEWTGAQSAAMAWRLDGEKYFRAVGLLAKAGHKECKNEYSRIRRQFRIKNTVVGHHPGGAELRFPQWAGAGLFATLKSEYGVTSTGGALDWYRIRTGELLLLRHQGFEENKQELAALLEKYFQK